MTFEVPALAAGFASRFDEIGPYIGFGSLVAVVAMAVLVFAQGRELQRLREWAGSSPERLDALEREVRDGAQRLAQPAPRPAQPGVAPAAGGAIAAPPPRPPGAPGAPAAPGTPAAPGSPVVGAAAATPPAAAPGGPPRPTPPRPTPPGAPPTRVLASSAAGGPRAATAAGAAASARDRDRDGGGAPPRSVWQIIGVSVVGVVVLFALLFAFGVVGGGDEEPISGNQPPSETQPEDPGNTQTTPRYPPREMRSIVLNGSGSGGLAKDVSDSIEEKFRFPMGEAANFNTLPGGTDTVADTTVYYRTGDGESIGQNRSAAQDVARFLKLTPLGRHVRRMPDNVKNGAAGQKLVVVVGQDYPGSDGPAAGSATPSGTSTTPSGAPTTPGSGTGGATQDGTTGGTGGTTSTPSDGTGTGQLTPEPNDLGVDGTGGTAVP